MAERLKCKKCDIEWTYFGYPAYMGCPNCGAFMHVPINHEETCSCCHGTGKIMTNVVDEPMYNGCDNDLDIAKVSKEILEKEQQRDR